MSQDLGARLLRAGLLTRGQLSDAVRAAGTADVALLLRALVDQGLPEDALAGFFLSVGFGPLVEKGDLESADPALLSRLTKETAHELLALPLHEQRDGVAMAMGDPTDAKSIETLALALRARVLPRVARVRDLASTLDARLSVHDSQTVIRDMSAELARMNEASSPEDETAVALVRKRRISFSPDDDTETTAVGKHPALQAQSESDELSPVPLVRQKAVSSPARAPSSEPPTESWSDAPGSGGDSWSDGLTLPGRAPSIAPGMATVVPTGSIAPLDALDTQPSGSAPGDISYYLDALSKSAERDAAVHLACEAALTVGRASVFFSVKKDVIQGRDAFGDQLSKDVVRSLSIPLTGSSNLRAAAVQGLPCYGPLGRSAAEALYAAVIGSRGANILFQPILLSGKPVGLLCVDGLRFDEAGRAQIVMIADALTASLSRIIKSGKK
ncbi:MAG: hypothetical protein IPK60_02500 [Sandaracinaceae bacterium]|nr:hypothetical protein [Sandaracinaceae bacterium]